MVPRLQAWSPLREPSRGVGAIHNWKGCMAVIPFHLLPFGWPPTWFPASQYLKCSSDFVSLALGSHLCSLCKAEL